MARQVNALGDVRRLVQALPASLDGTHLPNGVIELVVEDLESTVRWLFDIHEGTVTSAEPGQCVPWASICGSSTSWTRALGPARDASALQITGDERLAHGVLVALPRLSS